MGIASQRPLPLPFNQLENNMEKYKIDEIINPDYTQARLGNDKKTIDDYKDLMAEGVTFPPITLMKAKDAEGYYVIDGHHRLEAARALGWVIISGKEISGEPPGTKEDALYLATGANRTNGLRMTNADKRRAVRLALTIHPDFSDRVIAGHCGTTHPTVSKIRKELEGEKTDAPAEEIPEPKTVYSEFKNPEPDDSDSEVVNFTTQEEDSEEDYEDGSDSETFDFDEDDDDDTDSDSDEGDEAEETLDKGEVLTLSKTGKLGDIAQQIIDFYKDREFALTFISATITDYLKEQNDR